MGKTTSKIFDLQGKPIPKAKVQVPPVFKTPLRPDVIKRGVITLQSHRYQPQGRDPLAGKRRSVESLGAGHGMARVPRLKAGGQTAAFGVGIVKGRQAFPPVSQKKIYKKIPKKEMHLAIRSALAATGTKEQVAARGHIADMIKDFPLVVTDDIQTLKKTSQVEDAFLKLGLWPDIVRVKESLKERAGKGKGRGRRLKQAVGPLLVIAENGGIAQAARNLLGVDITTVNNLNVELLAPGTHPGRLTVWSKSAFEKLNELYA
ncbi:MAG TPA: 50S ribosomal protein L4 [Candidatus Bathyarchaeia archaeon]|nr:50S ribosomal protein L4 [Candidatus Bathyarchaeia archaeon]